MLDMKQVKRKVYEKTRANVYYSRSRRSWCASWLSNGFQHSLYFGCGITIESLIKDIENIQTKDVKA